MDTESRYTRSVPYEVQTACIAVWLIVSTILFLVSSGCFLLPEDTVLSLSNACKLPHDNHESSPLFGMTRAFLEITHWNFRNAIAYNHLSVVLFGSIVVNQFLVVIYSAKRIYRFFTTDTGNARQ